MIPALAMAAAAAAGCLFVMPALPTGWKPRWALWVLGASLGVGLGFALASFSYFVLLQVSVASPLLAIGVTLTGAMVWYWWLHNKRSTVACVSQTLQDRPFRWNWLLGAALLLQLTVCIAAMWALAAANPDGQWDAWGIWNLRAKFMADPQNWKHAVSPLLENTHPDYPLLQSGLIGLMWNLSGQTSPAVPLATAFAFFGSALGSLIAGLALLRGTSAGLLAGLVGLTAASYVTQPPAQYADVPLSSFYLATLLLIAVAHACRRRPLLFLAGLSASAAAWTKNEGVAFLATVLLGYFVVNWRYQGLRKAAEQWLCLGFGAVPGVLLTAYLKFSLAPAVDPLLRQGFSGALAKMADPARHIEILKANFAEAATVAPWYAHPLLLLAILAISLRFRIVREQRMDVVFGALTLALLFAVYWAVYLASTSLTWQLGTSLSRLHAQLWPAFLLLFFLVLGRIEDRAVASTP